MTGPPPGRRPGAGIVRGRGRSEQAGAQNGPAGRGRKPVAQEDEVGDGPVLPDALRGKAAALFTAVAAATRDGIAILGPTGELLLWNAAAATITGWSFAEAATRDLPGVVSASGALTEIRDGKWVEVRQSTLDSGGVAFTVVLFTDSTPQLRLRDTREQLQALGLIDRVTSLPGRELAMVHLDNAIALAKRDKRSVGVLALKLDRFRDLRATEDAASVDETLRQLAKRLSAFVRASDVSSRMSDGTFLVVLTALTEINDAKVVAVRLLLAMAEPFDVIGRMRTLHCSIGVAEAPRDAEQAAALLGAALGAADRAQVLGGGQFCVAGDREPAS
jgi:diguanylate cyclase (GGDEF)-like protein